MDAHGARILSERIAQQRHWEQADAVRDGRQPAVDPDLELLQDFGDGYRIYRPAGGNGTNGIPTREPFTKTLVDGWWVADLLPPAPARHA